MPTSGNDHIYFTKLEIENVKAFGESQTLDLTSDGKTPARWTLILGENNIGKTTLLQCLTRMRPDFANRAGDVSEEEGFWPELAGEVDNDHLDALVRNGSDVDAHLRLEMVVGLKFDGSGEAANHISCTATLKRQGGKFSDTIWEGARERRCRQPVVLAYGAGRHVRASKRDGNLPGPVDSLFDPAVELIDAEDALQRLDYLVAKARSSDGGPGARLNSLVEMLASILPEVQQPADIQINPPKTSGMGSGPYGVHIETAHGSVALDQVSLGYQTITAWTIDIAWRLFNEYPDSRYPMTEPAVVIVDEIDLHLHPTWQREIRKHLTNHFPNVQFIATAHSPLMAQDCLEENLALLRLDEEEGQTEIVNEPVVLSDWRIDQVMTSDLFGLRSARSVTTSDAVERRILLMGKKVLTDDEQAELEELERRVSSLGPGWTEDDELQKRIVEGAVAMLKERRRR